MFKGAVVDVLEKNYRQAVKQLSMMLKTDDNIAMQSKKLWCHHLLDEYKQVLSAEVYQAAQVDTKDELSDCLDACKHNLTR